jgi:hypothetical protein
VGLRYYAVRALAVFLGSLVACNSPPKTAAGSSGEDPDAVRYRLRLHDNEVDPAGAFRCYGECQSAPSPERYLACLSQCPGFEVTQGVTCARTEVPPETVCLTGRKLRPKEQVSAAEVVVATIAGIAIVVAAASLCASSSSQCGYYRVP